MKKPFKKLVAVCLIASLTLSLTPFGFVFADDWGDYDSLFQSPSPEPSYSPPPAAEPPPSFSAPSAGEFDDFDDFVPTQPVYEPAPYIPPAPPTPAYDPTPPPAPSAFDDFYTPAAPPAFAEPTPAPSRQFDDDFSAVGDFTATVDASSEGFIRVVRHRKNEMSEFQNAVIEGLQVSVEESREVEDEVSVTCYIIFRDRPTSFFYDIDRKEKKLVFEFVDARTGSSPIAALEQLPIKEIVIEESQVDANRSIKGLKPEWHDMIRISFMLEHLPVISVNNEHSIVSFTYKWTKDSEKIKSYLETDKFPLVFWISGGTLGLIGGGVLTYFLLPKKEELSAVERGNRQMRGNDDLPRRPTPPR